MGQGGVGSGHQQVQRRHAGQTPHMEADCRCFGKAVLRLNVGFYLLH